MDPFDREGGVLSSWCLLGLLASLSYLVGCQSPNFQPVEIVTEDMCSYCRMAITEKRYAAQFLDEDGQAFKFDDVACMMNYLKAKKDQVPVSHYYVVDFDSKQWITVNEAWFVRSQEFKTPMGGGTLAFGNQLKAERAATTRQGQLVSFNELKN